MREIKFRAWHKINKEFYNWGIGSIDNNGGLGTFPSDLIYLEHQQYTGLLDKNGVEIYEGDIIQGQNSSHIIYYDVNECRFIGIFNIENNLLRDGCHISKNWIEVFDKKVIGNIYENTELMQ